MTALDSSTNERWTEKGNSLCVFAASLHYPEGVNGVSRGTPRVFATFGGWRTVNESLISVFFSTEGQVNQEIGEQMRISAKSLDLPASGDQVNTRLVIAQMER